MYSIFIVDDEKLIRDGIKHLLDWRSLGFEIVGDEGNAEDAIKSIRALSPDLVIADIKMPGMNGLEMINRLKNDGYDGIFIVISGFADFKYAHAAIRHGVKSYLLKPIDERELAGEVYSVRKELDKKSGAVFSGDKPEKHRFMPYSAANKDGDVDLCGELVKAIHCNSSHDINDLLDRWKNSFITAKSQEVEIKLACINLYIQLSENLNSLHRVRQEIYKMQEFVEKVYLADDIANITDILKKHVLDIANAISDVIPDSSMEKALGYIENNYMTKLSVETVSGALHYNRAYFGRKFKSYTGQHFSIYLDKLRIEKAKGFLAENYKIYRISEMVGFSNVDIFNEKFKKYVGLSPSAYRRTIK